MDKKLRKFATVILAGRGLADLQRKDQNREYNRALVELTATILGIDPDNDKDDRATIEHLILG
jgi:hypothetical protein